MAFEILFVGVFDVCFVSFYNAGKKPTGVSEGENKRIPYLISLSPISFGEDKIRLKKEKTDRTQKKYHCFFYFSKRNFFRVYMASLIQEVTQSNAYMTFESSVKAAFIKYKFNTLINKWERRCYFKYFVNRICYCTREGIFPWGWERSFTKTARQPPNFYSTGWCSI